MNKFSDEIEAKANRKFRAQKNPAREVWSGLGMVGLVGWSVVVPTLIGAAIGIWLDNRKPGVHSWTLALLIAGLTLGCFNAWNWILKEDKEMHEDQGDL